MKGPSSYDPTDQLDHLRRVEAPPFLLTRIRQRAMETYEQRMTPAFAWASSCLLLCVFAMNAYVMIGHWQGGNKMYASHTGQQMNVFTDNTLYE
ncbi:hypothetical protein GCM10023093_06500 [Nemorincola caseinilytica]|uniref:Uncharacterized protein n=1 Tax=Nemorincola caseinilytica TaxID=2054315 RepID=A0ABP8N9M9_9BACT